MEKQLEKFKEWLIHEEKATATIEKYHRDVKTFITYCNGNEFTKERTLAYKEHLRDIYAPSSINTTLAAINSFFKYINRMDCCVKPIRLQKNFFASEDKELTKEEYKRLLLAADKSRIAFVIRTIATTGIRVSELKFITVEAVMKGKTIVQCKGKTRIIFLPKTLCAHLKEYIKKTDIQSGSIFITKNGNPLDRSNICKEMKALCKKANVKREKVFPHNLRHLFARTFYKVEKDLLRLADILGHTSINTTRIYTIETGQQHRKLVNRIGMILGTT